MLKRREFAKKLAFAVALLQTACASGGSAGVTLAQVQTVFQDLDDSLHVLAAAYPNNVELQKALPGMDAANAAIQALKPGSTTTQQALNDALSVLQALVPVVSTVDPAIGLALGAAIAIVQAFLGSGVLVLTAEQQAALVHVHTLARHRHR